MTCSHIYDYHIHVRTKNAEPNDIVTKDCLAGPVTRCCVLVCSNVVELQIKKVIQLHMESFCESQQDCWKTFQFSSPSQHMLQLDFPKLLKAGCGYDNCFGEENVNGSDVCHCLGEAFESVRGMLCSFPFAMGLVMFYLIKDQSAWVAEGENEKYGIQPSFCKHVA